MTDLLTAVQMRALEAAEIASGRATGAMLMERAGRSVVDAIFAVWPEFAQAPRRAVVLCGPGNNGGDGFVIARLLAEAQWEVRVHFLGDLEKLPPDARLNCDRWCASHAVLPLTRADIQAEPRPDLIVDAVFGIGLSRPLTAELAEALSPVTTSGWDAPEDIRTVAVDCPSGLDLDSGRVMPDGAAPRVDLTVTFHQPKIGHYLSDGPSICGTLRVVDIGVRDQSAQPARLDALPKADTVRLVGQAAPGRPFSPKVWPAPFIGKADTAAHKYDHGHAVVFAGGVGRGGAGRMAARAAMRAGAGLATVICPPAALIENAAQLNAVMLASLAKDQPLSAVADNRVKAFCLGPGMGVSPLTASRVVEALGHKGRAEDDPAPAVVLDADALTCFADDPGALFAHTHPRTVLTPHTGEFARLFPDLAAALVADTSKIDAVRAAAARAGCIVLLKGPDTVIAEPGGAAAVHGAVYDRAAPWLATAGAGDVLAGLITGLAAAHADVPLFVLVEIASWLHVEAAREVGPGLIAEDLSEALPAIFKRLGL